MRGKILKGLGVGFIVLLLFVVIRLAEQDSVQLSLAAALAEQTRAVREMTRSRLETFESTAELQQYAERLAATAPPRRGRSGGFSLFGALGGQAEESMLMEAAPSAAPPAATGESITNVQEAGVDEGGIVKPFRDFLVVLRRGRLLSARVSDGGLEPVHMVDASPPGTRGRGWYDEMLIHGDTIIVVGFSYSASATELGLFDIDDAGHMTHSATYYLRSNDYYSSRNYASRLVGSTLIFYMPCDFGIRRDDGGAVTYRLPGLRQWSAGDNAGDFEPVVEASHIYRPIQDVARPMLHTVVTCELDAEPFGCTARSVIGPSSRVFYVARDAVYVWVNDATLPGQARAGLPAPARAVVYRLPLREGPPEALRTFGAPVDQFSFKQSADEHLNVLVRSSGDGDGMWGPERSAGDVAMLRVTLSAFGPGGPAAEAERYRALPTPSTTGAFHNRFVGDHLLYGTGAGWRRPGSPSSGQLFVHAYGGGGETSEITLPHAVDRIEAMGSAAVVVGSDGSSLHFTAIRLDDDPRAAGSYVRENASQGEQRSHGFFYRPSSAEEGILGLPIRGRGQPGSAHLVHGSASILYVHQQELAFTAIGSLAATTGPAPDDHCQASCVDWYGNARPIFLGDRILALLGYELVEGRLEEGRLVESRRTDLYSNQPARN